MRDNSGKWMVLIEPRDYQPEDFADGRSERHHLGFRPWRRPHRIWPSSALRRVAPDDVDEFFAAVLRGFHERLHSRSSWSASRAVFEPGRNFGFAVDGRWVSTCGATAG